MHKWAKVSMVLGILLLIVLVYLGVRFYNDNKLAKEQEMFTQGAQYGYQTAVSDLMMNAKDCKPVDVYVQNTTMQLVDMSCVKQANS